MAEAKLTGGFEFAAALKEIGPQVAKTTLRRAVSNGVAAIRDEARARAPGTIAENIFMMRDATDNEATAKYSVFVKGGEDGAPHWRYLEYGTSKMAARPFLRPAFEAKKDEAQKMVADALNEGVQAAAQGLAK